MNQDDRTPILKQVTDSRRQEPMETQMASLKTMGSQEKMAIDSGNYPRASSGEYEAWQIGHLYRRYSNQDLRHSR